MNKNITCFISTLSDGGAEHQMATLSNILVECGYNVEIVTFVDIPDTYEISSKIKRINLAWGKSNCKKIYAILKYFLTIKRNSCVISYLQRCNMLCLIPLIFRRDVKVIVGERNLTYRTSMKENFLFDILYKRATYIVPNSYSQTKYILEKHPEYKNKLRTIINYTDILHYNKIIYKINSPIKIGVFSRYHIQKNYKGLVTALILLNKKCNIPYRIKWYGRKCYKNGTLLPAYKEFEALVNENQLKEYIELNDAVKDTAGIMNEFDVILQPSLYEGFSNTISEAICSGLPVIASNVSDNGIMVKDGINGFLFDPLDPQDFSEALMKFCLLTMNERYKMAQNSYEIAKQLFDKKKFVQKYLELINE